MAGAYGSMLAAVMDAQPHMTGVLFDQPQVRCVLNGYWYIRLARYAYLCSSHAIHDKAKVPGGKNAATCSSS